MDSIQKIPRGIRFEKITRIRLQKYSMWRMTLIWIRIIFSLRKSPEYQYEWYLVSKSLPNTNVNTSIRPQVFKYWIICLPLISRPTPCLQLRQPSPPPSNRWEWSTISNRRKAPLTNRLTNSLGKVLRTCIAKTALKWNSGLGPDRICLSLHNVTFSDIKVFGRLPIKICTIWAENIL